MVDSLRGDPDQLMQDRSGEGYFGRLATTEDPDLFATHLRTTVHDLAGRMAMDIPAIVPTLSRKELAHLVVGGRPTWGMIEKAKRHAMERLSAGVSVFAQPGEQHALPME